MNWWQALILGLVEGVTEFLPVSSTGHLLLAQRALGITQNDAANAYAICIQAGAILAVLGLYWKRMVQMSKGLLGKDPAGLRLALNIIVAFGLTGVLAVLLEKRVKAHLFNLPAITAAWLVGGLVILAWGWREKAKQSGPEGLGVMERGVETLTFRGAALIGLLQAVAMWPGTSRSLVTILAGLLVGLSLSAAVEFSFLLGVVTLLAATAKDLKEYHHAMAHAYSPGVMLLGTVVAALAAAAAVQWMVTYLQRHSLAIFGWYRLLLAAGVGLLLALGVLAS